MSGKAGTVRVWGGGTGGEKGEVEEEAGIEGHWTAVRERHRALANVALNMPVASGKGRLRKEIKEKQKREMLLNHVFSLW